VQNAFEQNCHVTVCGNTITRAGVLPNTITLQWHIKIHLLCLVSTIYGARALCEPSMWFYFLVLSGRTSVVQHSDELGNCESVTPASDHSTVEALPAKVLLLVHPFHLILATLQS
jgi:hypothetical protein